MDLGTAESTRCTDPPAGKPPMAAKRKGGLKLNAICAKLSRQVVVEKGAEAGSQAEGSPLHPSMTWRTSSTCTSSNPGKVALTWAGPLPSRQARWGAPPSMTFGASRSRALPRFRRPPAWFLHPSPMCPVLPAPLGQDPSHLPPCPLTLPST